MTDEPSPSPAELIASLPPPVLTRFDTAILGRHPLQAVMYLRAHFAGFGIHDSLELVNLRYAQLRAARPDDFASSHEAYWEGFYS